MPVQQPARCLYGHPWGPRLIVAGFMPCGCSGAKEGRNGNGHLWMLCLEGEDGGRGRKTFCYEPAHVDRRDYMPAAVMRRDGSGSWCSLPIEEMKRRTGSGGGPAHQV